MKLIREASSVLTHGWNGTAILIVLTVLLMLTLGLVFVHSATESAESGFPGPYSSSQLKKVVLGLVVMLAISCVSPRRIEKLTPFFFGATVALLLGLFAYKLMAGGVVRWVRIPGFQFQPSELAKISTVMMLATLLRGGLRQSRWRNVLSILASAAIPFLLIASQPDLGTAMILVPVVVAMIWVAQLRKRRLFLLILCSIALGSLAFLTPLIQDYHKTRIMTYLGLTEDSVADQGAYQINQSIIALASGGPLGKGMHMGTHHDLGYLPEDHNDFIFAVIGEEWGFQGTLLVVAGFLLLGFTMLGLAWSTRDHFGRLLVVGIATLLVSQSLVNQAVVIELLPVTGLTLPFISYGGTSIVVSLIGVGLVLSVARHPIAVMNSASPKQSTASRSGSGLIQSTLWR